MATETTAQNKRARAHAPRLNISGRSNQHKQASGPNSPGHQSTRPPENQGRRWILKKKEQARKRGKTTAADSKYSGRKRKDRL
jgi:18S rRNA (guanine1575-N7)-methyltransferase